VKGIEDRGDGFPINPDKGATAMTYEEVDSKWEALIWRLRDNKKLEPVEEGLKLWRALNEEERLDLLHAAGRWAQRFEGFDALKPLLAERRFA